jgi:hypothetical protein
VAGERIQVADRARATLSRKRAGTRRPAKKKRTRRRLGIFALALLGALILGFLAKRIMIPSAVHYIAYRPPEQSPPAEANPPANPNSNADTNSEQLTPSDRRQLDAIIKQKAK